MAINWRVLRKVFIWPNILRAVGLLGVLHEVLFTSLDRPSVLILFATMLGLPWMLADDERKHPRA